MTRTRILFWTLLMLSGVVILYGLDKQPVRGHVGSVIACSGRFPFHDSQAEILEYGLQDIRGLAWDEDKRRIFLSEGDRSLLIDWLDSEAGTSSHTAALPNIEETEARTMCPGERCGVASERGLAILGGKLFSAEHGRGQIVVRDLPQARFLKDKQKDEGAAWLLSASPLPGKHEVLTEPSGIAAVDGTLFITNEPLRPTPTSDASPAKAPPSNAGASKDNSNASNAEDPEKATAKPRGALFVCSADRCLPEIITSSLHHPSGVAAERANGPIIVAEADAHEVRWPVYEKLDGKWQETRSLGSVPVSGEVVPAFLGIALDDSRKMVFAAGPGGLYVFDLEGTLLGRIMFDDPVTGVATGGDHVYLAVGETLCALTFDHSSHPNTTIVPPPAPLANFPTPVVGQPAPKSRVPKPPLDAAKAKIGPGKKPTNPSRPYTAQPDPSKEGPQAKGKKQNCECKKQKEQS